MTAIEFRIDGSWVTVIEVHGRETYAKRLAEKVRKIFPDDEVRTRWVHS